MTFHSNSSWKKINTCVTLNNKNQHRKYVINSFDKFLNVSCWWLIKKLCKWRHWELLVKMDIHLCFLKMESGRWHGEIAEIEAPQYVIIWWKISNKVSNLSSAWHRNGYFSGSMNNTDILSSKAWKLWLSFLRQIKRHRQTLTLSLGF